MCVGIDAHFPFVLGLSKHGFVNGRIVLEEFEIEHRLEGVIKSERSLRGRELVRGEVRESLLMNFDDQSR